MARRTSGRFSSLASRPTTRTQVSRIFATASTTGSTPPSATLGLKAPSAGNPINFPPDSSASSQTAATWNSSKTPPTTPGDSVSLQTLTSSGPLQTATHPGISPLPKATTTAPACRSHAPRTTTETRNFSQRPWTFGKWTKWTATPPVPVMHSTPPTAFRKTTVTASPSFAARQASSSANLKSLPMALASHPNKCRTTSTPAPMAGPARFTLKLARMVPSGSAIGII